jgi:diguanylate cyclase (GGDEF)-like protein/putative nucleotidyltransferase with HDIG domain
MQEYPFWTKKKEVLLLRWLLITAIGYLLIFSLKKIDFNSIEFLLIVFLIISNVILHLLKEEIFLQFYFDWVLVIFDTLFVAIFIYFTQSALNEFYLAFFIIIILSTLGENLKIIAINSLIICLIYAALQIHYQVTNGIYHADLMLRVPFLFICSIFYGNLVSKLKRRKRIIEHIEIEKREIMAVYEISNAISTLLDTRRILREVIENLNNLLANKYCQIILIDKDKFEGKIINQSFPQKEEILNLNECPEIQKVLITKEMLLIPDIMQEPLLIKVRGRFAAKGITSINLFPMVFQNEVLGIIYIYSKDMEQLLTHHWIRLLKVIAATTGNAVKNAQLFEKVQLQASTDELSGLCNYRHFQQLFEIEVQRAKRKKTALAMLFIDIDNLKTVNDIFGHPQGDRVIIDTAKILKQKTRALDVKARYAGDEFICLLPDADPEHALKTAKRICEEVERKFKSTYSMITLSIGVASFPSIIDKPEDLLLFADQAMYLAKYNGGNQAQLASFEDLQDIENWNKKALEAFITIMSKRHFQTGREMADRLSYKLKAVLYKKHISPTTIEMVTALATAIDVKDHYTKGHSIEVREYSIILADELNLSEDEKENIGLAALLHDIGKIGISEDILAKPEKLDLDEEEKIKQHPVIGAKILEPIKAFKDIIPLIRYHHENWDGSGYPEGLKGEEIPIGAQIISIVDVFHSLTSKRSYRKRLSFDNALKIMKEDAGKKWNPKLCETFLKIIKKYEKEIMKRDID